MACIAEVRTRIGNFGKVTADAGLLAVRELNEALHFMEQACDLPANSRTGKNTRHDLGGLLSQSMYARLAAVYMCVLSAVSPKAADNPIKHMCWRRVAQGKERMVAIGSCMRKMNHIIFGILMSGKLFPKGERKRSRGPLGNANTIGFSLTSCLHPARMAWINVAQTGGDHR